MEDPKNTHMRCEGFKSYLVDYLTARSDEQNGPGQHQVAVVGHSMYFTYMTATEWHTKADGSADYSQAPSKSRFLSNCEFYPYDSHLADRLTKSMSSPATQSEEEEFSPCI